MDISQFTITTKPFPCIHVAKSLLVFNKKVVDAPTPAKRFVGRPGTNETTPAPPSLFFYIGMGYRGYYPI